MATNTAYESLKQKVSDLTAAVSKKEAEVSALQNDPSYPGNLATVNYYTNPPAADLVGALGSSTYNNWVIQNQAKISSALSAVDARNTSLKAKQGELASLKTSLADANKALSDYEQNSPTLKASVAESLLSTAGTIKNTADAIKNDRVLVVGIVVLVVLVAGIIFYAVKRKA